ncbi:hypothetical protein [Anaerosporobacter sp.]
MCDYYISDGKNQYITTKGGIRAVGDLKQATLMNLAKATNVLKTMPKTLLKVKDWTILPVPEESGQSFRKDNTFKTYEFVGLDTIINDMTQFTEIAETYAKYSKTINSQLAEVELEIEDLYHYIEFSSFNAAQGYKAYKMLKERLVKRRELKDSIILLDSVQEKNMLTCSIDNINDVVNKLESRSYRPRVLKELFV